MKLDIRSFGLTTGIIFGVLIFICTLFCCWEYSGGFADEFLYGIESICPGYSITWGGSIIGLIWGFIDGMLIGMLFAFLYNRFISLK